MLSVSLNKTFPSFLQLVSAKDAENIAVNKKNQQLSDALIVGYVNTANVNGD